MRSVPWLLRVLAAATFCLPATPASGQAPPGPLPPRPGAKPQPAKEAPQIRVRVDLVATPVTVRNAAGELVFDLTAGDFRVYDNGVEQRIENFDLGGEPLSIVLLLETSSRVEALLPAVRRTGIVFTETVMGQTGEAAVLGFDDDVRALLPFTTDKDRIEKAVAGFRMGTSGSRLYDALAQGISLLSERVAPVGHGRRKVIVAMTEAADTGSDAALGAVLREAQLANVTIYIIGLSSTAAMLRGEPKSGAPPTISPPGTFGRPPIPGTVQTPTTEQQRSGQINLLALIAWLVSNLANTVGDNSLEAATTGTGGLHVATFSDRSIEKAMDAVGAELHAQYSLAYRPTGSAQTGYHDIKVEVKRRGVHARSRPGYYIPPPD